MTAGGLILGILCGTTAALLVVTMGAGWLMAFAAYAVFGSVGLMLALMPFDGPAGD